MVERGLSLIASSEVATKLMATEETEQSSDLVPRSQSQSSRSLKTAGSAYWMGKTLRNRKSTLVGCACVSGEVGLHSLLDFFFEYWGMVLAL